MKLTRILISTLLLGILLSLSACKQQQPNGTPPPASMVSIG
jgi:hypothetical protein